MEIPSKSVQLILFTDDLVRLLSLFLFLKFLQFSLNLVQRDDGLKIQFQCYLISKKILAELLQEARESLAEYLCKRQVPLSTNIALLRDSNYLSYLLVWVSNEDMFLREVNFEMSTVSDYLEVRHMSTVTSNLNGKCWLISQIDGDRR